MFNCDLYLAFPIDGAYQEKLDQVSPSLRDLFIQNRSDSLSFIRQEGKLYLGKKLELPVEMTHLDLSRSHLISVLRRLVSDYPYEQASLFLVSLLEE